ncbi:MAG: hypothetical protein V7607_1670 [Solirubrobacteraceae bacterium]
MTVAAAGVQLGKTDMTISSVGFGAWAIAGNNWAFGWGPQDDHDSIAAIHAAVNAGVNWIDTAAVYGLGHSEEVVGRALAALPEADRPLVFTKCGLVWDEDDRAAPPRKIMRPASVRRELEASLRRLGVETIDLYQVHWPGDGGAVGLGVPGDADATDGTPLEEYWELMAELKAEGKVHAIGLSNHDCQQLETAEAVAHVDALQPPFSALQREAAPEVAWCHAHGTAVIAYSPMQSGLLTGSIDADRVRSLPASDWRSSHPDFTTELERNLEVTGALARVAERHRVSTAAAAVAWVLAWPGITGAIVGARKPDQIAGWITATSLELSDEDLDDVASALVRTGAGEGPVRPG